MKKIRIAILEDSDLLLDLLARNLEATGFAEVVLATTSSKTFLSAIAEKAPDAVLLDIELEGDPMNGLDIANLLRLPVLFTSSQMGDYIHQIEELNLALDVVEHLSKPLSIDKLKKVLPKFIREVQSLQSSDFAYLDFDDQKRLRIPVANIVCLCTDKLEGANSNNKQIYFRDRRKATLIDFSFSKMSEKGLTERHFVKVHKSFIVNIRHIRNYRKSLGVIEIDVFLRPGAMETLQVPVSEKYAASLASMLT